MKEIMNRAQEKWGSFTKKKKRERRSGWENNKKKKKLNVVTSLTNSKQKSLIFLLNFSLMYFNKSMIYFKFIMS